MMNEIEKYNKCWQTIGVYGNGTCEKIDKYIHCRNCSEYAKAGRNLLNREITTNQIEEWTELYSIPKKQEDSQTISVIIFRLENEWFALKTIYFQETIATKPIHTVPFRTNKELMGLVNVSGELLLVVSAHNLFELTNTYDSISNKSFARMIVISRNNQRCVLPVDEVSGVRQINVSIIQKPPVTLSKTPTSLSSGIFQLNNRSIGLIDEDKLFASIERILQW